MKKKKKKQIFKYSLIDIIDDYCWIVGLSLFIGSLTLLFANSPWAILGVGFLITIIAAVIKGFRRN